MGEWTDGDMANELLHREAGGFGRPENTVDVIHQLLVVFVDDVVEHAIIRLWLPPRS